MSLATPGPVLRRLFRAPVRLYRWRLGWLLGRRFLLLTHTGRRSGLTRRTVLEVVRYDPETSEAVVVAGWGPGSDWYRNIQARPPLEVVIGRRRFRPCHRLLDEDEAQRVIAAYEHRNRFIRPLVRAGFSRLLGWRYDGSEASRRRLVRQLPLVSFRPDGDTYRREGGRVHGSSGSSTQESPRGCWLCSMSWQ